MKKKARRVEVDNLQRTGTSGRVQITLIQGLLYLDNARDDLVRYNGPVLLPIFPILVFTPLVVTERAVKEQEDEERDVKVGNEVVKKSGSGPAWKGRMCMRGVR